MLIQLSNADFYYNEKKVFENISVQVSEYDRIGLVGRNGEGKTTLLGVLTKELEPRNGAIYHKSSLSVGYLKQNSGLNSDKTVYDEMKTVFEELYEAERSMRRLETEMSSMAHDSYEYKVAAQKYDAKLTFFVAGDGYNIDVKIKTVLSGMGLGDCFGQIIDTMSGGEKTRLALCKLLLLEPELLILDEPTNHLDFATLRWLETYLSGYKGALLIVSHDRYFLDKLAAKIWDMENYTVTEYTGNYTKYKLLKQEHLVRSLKEYERQQEKIAKMQDYAQRNIARASTSKSAKSRLKQIDNMDILEKPYEDTKDPVFCFDFAIPSQKNVLTVKGLNIAFGEKILFSDASMSVKRGEKAAILGANGTGKSTFIKRVMKSAEEGSARVSFGEGVTLSYYDQENLNLDPNDTVLSAAWGKHFRKSQTYIRNVLARALLRAEDMDKKVSQLSGGERAKLGIALMEIDGANTLIMDEPTNHLDLNSRESLEDALADYEGTLIFVSHDRYFIQRIADRIFEVEDCKFKEYDCPFDEYVLRKTAAETVESQKSEKQKPKNYLNTKERKEQAALKVKLKETELRINDTEAHIALLENKLISPEVTEDYKAANQICIEIEHAREELDELLRLWEELGTRLT